MKKTCDTHTTMPDLGHILAAVGADIQNMRPFLPRNSTDLKK